MRRKVIGNIVILTVSCFFLWGCHEWQKVQMGPNPKAGWLAEGCYGVMVHYFITPDGQTEEENIAEFNQIIDNFDIDYFMNQFEQTGADWLIFTIAQNTGWYNSSNPLLDRLVPGHTPKRDLVLEIGRKIKQMNKKLILYIGAEHSPMPEYMHKALGWGDLNNQKLYHERNQELIRNYSIKMGKRCDGWWIDGVYPHLHQYNWPWNDWINAMRAGNPDTIIAFNDGSFCIDRIKPVTPLQDYTSGEIHLLEEGKIRTDFMGGVEPLSLTKEGYLRKQGQEPTYFMPQSQFVDGVQFHALLPLDASFCHPRVDHKSLDYSDAELLKFVKAFKSVKGAVTINVPIEKNGHISDKSFGKLKRLGKSLNCNQN